MKASGGSVRRAWMIGVVVWLAGCGGSGDPADPGPGDGTGDGSDVPGDVTVSCRTEADCAALDPGPCGRRTCLDGTCGVVADEAREGASCQPIDRCAEGGGTCVSGACVPVRRKACPVRECLSGGCDEATGECRYESLADGEGCDRDANACTKDRCVGGACQAGANECECGKDEDCPGPKTLCAPPLSCDPASQRCVTGGSLTKCPVPADPCRVATCDEATGRCGEEARADGTECEAATVCSEAGTCLDGECRHRPRCVDGDPCTEDRCDPSTGACRHPPANGAACEDGDLCTAGDACANGACVPGAAMDCDDGNPCTSDTCVPATGCAWTPLGVAIGCDDGDPCTVLDACSAQAQCVGTAMDCDDGNPCTEDDCDPATGGCRHRDLDATPCQDANPCTAGDACRAGSCVPGAWTPGCCVGDGDCDDGDPCTAERCDAGTCAWDGEPEGRCAASAGECGPTWCQAGTGECQELDLRLPRRLLGWDLRTGGAVPGFRWSGGKGMRGEAGAGPAEGEPGASFRIPGRRVPSGLALLVLDAGASACDAVKLYRGELVVSPDE